MRVSTVVPSGLLALSVVSACEPEPGDACAEPAIGVVCVVAGTGELGFNRDGLEATQTDLFLVSAARRGPDGLVYVMDFNNQRLRRINEDHTMETLIGDGFHALAATDVPITDTPLENPIDFRFLSDGRITFVSYHDPRVLEVGEDEQLHAVAGAGEVAVEGGEGADGPPLAALFIQLDGIALTQDDTLYVSDSLAHRVRRIEGDVITTVAGTGVAEYSGDGGPGVDAGLNWPTALELDEDGNLFIADARNHVVRRLSPDGMIETIAGTGEEGYSGDGGPATEAELNQPYGLALDDEGSLYVADRANFVVRKVSSDGDIETIAGTGDKGASGDGGPALEARFGFLARLSVDGDALLVADQSNSLVRRITLR